MSERIDVWYDSESDPAKPAWCVSIMHEETDDEVECIGVFASKDDAVADARAEARTRGIRLCEVDQYGDITELESAEAMALQSVLLRHDLVHITEVESEAARWASCDLDADEAGRWLKIGVWDAETAAALRDAGLTPAEVKAAAQRLIAEAEDPRDIYTDGDPIYAACNGDLDISVIIEAAAD